MSVDDIKTLVHKKLTEMKQPGYISPEQYEVMAQQARLAAEAERSR